MVRNTAITKIYIDGIEKGSSSSCSITEKSAPLQIGQYYGVSNNYDLNGYLDEFRITKGLARWTGNFTPPTAPYNDGPRTPSVSLTPDMTNNKIDLDVTGAGDEGAFYPDAEIELDETGLVGHWKMDGDFTDSSGNGNDGTVSGGVVATADGQKRQAGSFDGVDDYVSIADSASLDIANSLTLSAWVKYDGYLLYPTFISKNSNNYRLFINPDGTVTNRLTLDGIGSVNNTSTSALAI